MIEIFTRGAAPDSQPVRSTGPTLHLNSPADVYLGRASAGIAYYEKAGTDLRVTLLDQQVVVIKDFFSMGENGEFSRLLRNDGSTVEVTGLIAPEPFVPREDSPKVASMQVEAPAEITPSIPPGVESTPAANAGQSHNNDTVPAEAVPSQSATSGSGAGFFGIPGELLLFGAANVAMLWTGLRDNDSAPTAAQQEMDPEVAAMLASIEAATPAAGESGTSRMAGDSTPETLSFASADSPAVSDTTIIAEYY